MKAFGVTIPITGTLYIEVEAENEEQAMDLAIEECTIDYLENWQPTRVICEGNVLDCIQNEISAEEL